MLYICHTYPKICVSFLNTAYRKSTPTAPAKRQTFRRRRDDRNYSLPRRIFFRSLQPGIAGWAPVWMQGWSNLASLTGGAVTVSAAEVQDGGRPAEAAVATRDMDELLAIRTHFSPCLARTHHAHSTPWTPRAATAPTRRPASCRRLLHWVNLRRERFVRSGPMNPQWLPVQIPGGGSAPIRDPS